MPRWWNLFLSLLSQTSDPSYVQLLTLFHSKFCMEEKSNISGHNLFFLFIHSTPCILNIHYGPGVMVEAGNPEITYNRSQHSGNWGLMEKTERKMSMMQTWWQTTGYKTQNWLILSRCGLWGGNRLVVRKVLEDKTFVLSQRIGRTAPKQVGNSYLCHGSSFFIQSGPWLWVHWLPRLALALETASMVTSLPTRTHCRLFTEC